MTLGEWLDTRTPKPPPELMGRLQTALGPDVEADARYATERCVSAAERVVAQLLHEGRTGRESAADLLAADALVTYAFEAASDDTGGLTDRARAAMVQLARLGATP